MTEVAVDSVASTEHPDGASSAEESSPEMGMGFLESDDTPSDSDGAIAEQPAAVDGAVDVAPNTQGAPTQGAGDGDRLRHADYTRKTQQLAERTRQVEAELQRGREENRIHLEAMERLNQQLRQSVPAAPDPVQALAAQLGPDEARGLTVVDQLVQERAQKIAAEQISAALEPYKQYLDNLGPMSGMVSQVAQQQTAQARQEADAQIEAAESIFGKLEAWDQGHRQLVGVLTKEENPATGDRFTVAEAMATVTGRNIQDHRSAVDQQRRARNNAKRTGPGQAGSPALTDSGGTITREQALSEIRSTL
jgi:hypothetical protein